jgi:hypothetical protein
MSESEAKDILTEIKLLNAKLYGENNFKGDIPEIIKSIEAIKACMDKHSTDIAILKDRQDTGAPSAKRVVGFGTTIGTAIAGFIYFIGDKAGWWS